MRAQRTVGVGVFVLCHDKDVTGHQGPAILLGRRGQDCKRGAGCLALPGGMLDEGETINEIIRREVMEETGLTVKLPPAAHFEVPGILAVTDHAELHHENQPRLPHLTFWVLALYGSGTPQVMEPGKCAGWSWYDSVDLEKLDVHQPSSEQYYWTPLPLWRRILWPFIHRDGRMATIAKAVYDSWLDGLEPPK